MTMGIMGCQLVATCIKRGVMSSRRVLLVDGQSSPFRTNQLLGAAYNSNGAIRTSN